MTELQRINEEIQRLERRQRALTALRNAKLELLKKNMTALPSEFWAQHPVVYTLLHGTATAAKEASKEAFEGLKKGGHEVASYMLWAQEHPGKGWMTYLAERKAKKRLVKV